jgi:hypothetical protein
MDQLNQFTFAQFKNDRVTIFYRERPVTTLKGKLAIQFLARIEHADSIEQQRIMAGVTGNFKRGNEHPVKNSRQQ